MKGLESELIQSAAPDWRVLVFEEVGSTNDVAKDLGLQGEDGCIAVLAESQTAGRGQRSNRWVTPGGRDIMMSLLLRPPVPLELWPRLTTLAALAVCRAIELNVPVEAGIKWPNDIYISGKKICGLLAESYIGGKGAFVVLGIGINVNTVEFPPELQGAATSILAQAGGRLSWVPREPVVAAVLNQITELLGQMDGGFEQAVMEVRQRSILIGKNVRARVDGNIVHGRVRDLNHEGHLILEMLDGKVEELASAAEVRVE